MKKSTSPDPAQERRSVALTVTFLPEVLTEQIAAPLHSTNPYMQQRLLWGLMTVSNHDRQVLMAAPEFRYRDLAAIDWTSAETIRRLHRQISAAR